jgi:hypothetical protein
MTGNGRDIECFSRLWVALRRMMVAPRLAPRRRGRASRRAGSGVPAIRGGATVMDGVFDDEDDTDEGNEEIETR